MAHDNEGVYDSDHSHGHKGGGAHSHHHGHSHTHTYTHSHSHGKDSGHSGKGSGGSSHDDSDQTKGCISCAKSEQKCDPEALAWIVNAKLNEAENTYCSIIHNHRQEIKSTESHIDLMKHKISLYVKELHQLEADLTRQQEFTTHFIKDHGDACCDYEPPCAEPDPCCPAGDSHDHHDGHH